jgi:anti-anti-sigma factor
MSLKVQVSEGRSLTRTLALEGRLDHDSVADFDRELDAVLASPVKVVVFDLGALEYVTSAGLRSILQAHKVMTTRAGRAVILNPQPQVQKVLDIIKMPGITSIFKNVRELDDYLDAMQKKVVEGGDAS